MKVKIKYYEHSWDEEREFAFEIIEEVESTKQAQVAAKYDCEDQGFDHYTIEIVR